MFHDPGSGMTSFDESPSIAEAGSWRRASHLQWSMQNISSFLPVRPVPAGARVAEFGTALSDVSGIAVPNPWAQRTTTVGELIAETYTDAFMVTRNGVIVAEQYYGAMQPSTLHLLMSVSKSLTTATAGVLVSTGRLRREGLVTDYVPALATSGYRGATVGDLLDMRTGIRFSEKYLDESAEVRMLEQAIGWTPRRSAKSPGTLLDFLASLVQVRPHGGVFDYKSCETDALAFAMQGATGGRHPADLMSELVWKPMGAEATAHVSVDSVGAGMFDGGVSATLRDLARFGNLFLRAGYSLDGMPVLPSWWVGDTFEGAIDSREAFAGAPEPTLMPGGMYRNGFWFPRPGSNVCLALGIHGQMIYMDRANGIVGVKLSSWPQPQDGSTLMWTLAGFDAIARAIA